MSNQIVIWAGSDWFATVDVPPHASAKACVDHLMPQVEEIFGKGAEIVQVSDTRWEIRVNKVRTEA